MIDGSVHNYAAHGHCRRRQHRQRSQLVRIAFQPGQLVCIRSARVESDGCLQRPSRTSGSETNVQRTNATVRRVQFDGLMLKSREAVVDYMTPLGLAHIMATRHHYGPGRVGERWSSRLDAGRITTAPIHAGIGFDRTANRQQRRRPIFPRRCVQQFSNRRTRLRTISCCWSSITWDGTIKVKTGRTVWLELVCALLRRCRLGAQRCSAPGIPSKAGTVDAVAL